MTTVLPEPRVEIAFTTPAFSSSPVFVDVSADLYLQDGVQWFRGRTDNQSTIGPSTASFSLDTSNGNYTPGNASGSHYPNVKRTRTVRISMTQDRVTYTPQWYGQIDTISETADNETGLNARSVFTCVDAMKRLATASISTNPIEQAIRFGASGQPVDYWTMGDPSGAIAPANVGVGPSRTSLTTLNNTGANVQTVAFGATEGVSATDGLTGVTVTNSGLYPGRGAHVYVNTFAALLAITVNTFDQSSGWFGDLIALGGGSILFDCTLIAGGFVQFTCFWSGGSFNVVSAVPVTDGALHVVEVQASASLTGGFPTAIRLFVDGADQGGVVQNILQPWSVSLFDVYQSGPNQFTSSGSWVGSEVAIWANTGRFATGHVDVANAILNGYSPESSSARISRISAYFPQLVAPTVSANPGSTRMGPFAKTAGSNVLALIQAVEVTEGGLYYIDPTGVPTARSRFDLYNQSVALTLGTDVIDPGYQSLLDDYNQVNDYVATGTSGNPQEWTDSTTFTDDGEIPGSQTLDTLDDTEALAYAQYKVVTGHTPGVRAPQLVIDALTQQVTVPGLLAAIWGLDLGDLVKATALPTNAPATTVTLQVQGIGHVYRRGPQGGEYTVTLSTSPAPIQVWELQDAVLGQLDSTTVLAW